MNGKKKKLDKHKDWIRDVSWAPNIGLPYDMIASCSQDQTVVIWTSESNSEWTNVEINIEKVAWRVSWSITGNILAVSSSDNKITLFKETIDGKWKKISTLDNENENSNN